MDTADGTSVALAQSPWGILREAAIRGLATAKRCQNCLQGAEANDSARILLMVEGLLPAINADIAQSRRSPIGCLLIMRVHSVNTACTT